MVSRRLAAAACGILAMWTVIAYSPAALGQAPLKVPPKVQPFSLQQVRLLDGPFKHAMELDQKYLLSLDPDRLLHNFRVSAGLPSSAKPLGGWEEPKCELRGHSVGHYLSACAMMYAGTGDVKLKERADLIVAELAKCQGKIGSGYLSAFPEEFIDRVEAGKRVWAPWYTLHKIYAGLLDVHLLCDNREALEVLEMACHWVKSRTDKLSDEQVQFMLRNEHGGMNDVLAELYAVTGDPQYLKLSQRFNHWAVLGPLAKREDRLTGLHANTQFPKILGAARQYDFTGEERLHTIAAFFWDVVTKERSYVIGGNSDNEAFSPKEELSKHIGPSTTETCNTYNMLKITRRLFCWDPKPEYADYYERALYNHILASQHPETGMVVYYLPLKTGSQKVFSSPNDSFWCCVGTGMENHAKYGESIYFVSAAGDAVGWDKRSAVPPGTMSNVENQMTNQSVAAGGTALRLSHPTTLYVNLFIASELDWREQGIKLRQETKYPEEQATRLVFTCQKPMELSLKVRHPYWAVSGFEIAVNGEGQATASKPGSYATILREWKTGDRVEIKMPMSLRTEGFRDNPRKLAVMYGPLVLCAEVEPGSLLQAVVAEPGQVLSSVKPVEGKPLRFSASGKVFRMLGAVGQVGNLPDDGTVRQVGNLPHDGIVGQVGNLPHDVILAPLSQEYQQPYIVYWDVLDEAQWNAKADEHQADLARQKALEGRTVDRVVVGNQRSERQHALKGERTAAGPFGGRQWRHATDGGWFSYDLKVLRDKPVDLLVNYWGSDAGAREFDILVDGTKIATQKLERNRPERFYDETYPIPQDLTKGKDTVTVRFQAHPGRTAGGIFDCRMLRKE